MNVNSTSTHPTQHITQQASKHGHQFITSFVTTSKEFAYRVTRTFYFKKHPRGRVTRNSDNRAIRTQWRFKCSDASDVHHTLLDCLGVLKVCDLVLCECYDMGTIFSFTRSFCPCLFFLLLVWETKQFCCFFCSEQNLKRWRP